MASQASGAILFGFAALFSCLYLLQEAKATTTQHGRFAQIAAAAFIPAVVTTFGLTQLLLFAHVRALGAAGGAGGGDAAGRRFLRRLAKATLLAAAAALLAGAVTCLAASGYIGGGGADDVGWLHRKK